MSGEPPGPHGHENDRVHVTTQSPSLVSQATSSVARQSVRPAASPAAATPEGPGNRKSRAFSTSPASERKPALTFSPTELGVFMTSPWAAWMERLHKEHPDRVKKGTVCAR